MLQMLFFNLCEGWKKFWHHFGLFLSLFSTFHQNFLQLCKKLPSYISETHQLLFPLVNNGQNWCQKLCTFFSPLLILQGECAKYACIPGYFLECFRSKKSLLARVGLGWQTRADAVFRSPDPRQLIKKVPAQLGQYIPSHYHDLGILKTGIWQ